MKLFLAKLKRLISELISLFSDFCKKGDYYPNDSDDPRWIELGKMAAKAELIKGERGPRSLKHMAETEWEKKYGELDPFTQGYIEHCNEVIKEEENQQLLDFMHIERER